MLNSFKAFACLAFFLAYSSFAKADSTIPLVPITAVELERIAAASGASTDELLFAKMVLEEARSENSSVISPDALKKTITKFVLTPKLSVDETAALIAVHMSQSPESLADTASISAGLTTQLLLPYMYQANACTGDLWSGSGLICSYLAPGTGTTVSGNLTDVAAGSSWEMPQADPTTDLGQVLAQAVQKCSVRTSAQNGPPPGSCFALRSMEGRIVVARLSTLEFTAYYALLVAKYAEYAADPNPKKKLSDYFGDYLLDVLKGQFVNLEIYGEYYLAANIDYLADDSDSAIAIYPFGYKCKLSRCESFGKCAARRGADALACGDMYGERRYWDIRPSGSYLQHSIAACNAAPVPSAARPTFQAVQQGVYPLPYGVTFQTKYQQAARLGVPPATGLHLYPAPTSYSGPVVPYPETALTRGIPNWRYDFLKVRTWDYNLVFAGLKSVLSGIRNCQGYRYFGNKYASGDAFWMWHGQGQGYVVDCDFPPFHLDNGCPDYVGNGGSSPMPTVNLIWGQTLKHEPIACGADGLPCVGLDCPLPVDPPCNGLDCLPPPPPPPCDGLDCVPPIPIRCGNGQCELGEEASCSADCGPVIGICGDGVCGNGPFENPMTCPSDCGAGG